MKNTADLGQEYIRYQFLTASLPRIMATIPTVIATEPDKQTQLIASL